MKKIIFETSMCRVVPEGCEKALANTIERFINGISILGPLPAIRAEIVDFEPGENEDLDLPREDAV